jgi:putative transposase
MALNELHRARTLIFSCKYHVVFCPKYRRKLLVPPIDRRIKEMILEKQDQYSYAVVEIEVMPDRVHLLLDVDPRVGIDAVVRKIKGYTAYRILQEYPWMKDRLPSLWTRSRFIATVGAVSLETVKRYIEEQKGA